MGDDDGAGVAEGCGGVDAGEAGVAARGGVEVEGRKGFVAVGRGGGVVAQAGEEVVGDAARFKGAGGLEGFEFEEDSAVRCEMACSVA